MLLLSDVPFETLGYRTDLLKEPLPMLTWAVLHQIPRVVAVGGVLMSGIWWITNRRNEVQRAERDEKLRRQAAEALRVAGLDPAAVKPTVDLAKPALPDFELFRRTVNPYLYRESVKDRRACAHCHATHRIFRLIEPPAEGAELAEQAIEKNYRTGCAKPSEPEPPKQEESLPGGPPLTRHQVILLLDAKVDQEKVIRLIEKRKAAFEVAGDAATTNELKAAGADAKLLGALVIHGAK